MTQCQGKKVISYAGIVAQTVHIQPPVINPPNITVTVDDAPKYTFNEHWTVWIHKNETKDWSINSYHKLMIIHDIGDFWSFMNNFNKLDYINYQFFFMRGDISPTWEHPENYNGGAATFRIKITDNNKGLLAAWSDICLYALNNTICTDERAEINGVSFNLKRDLTIVKVWNKYDIDICRKINDILVKKHRLNTVVHLKNRPTA